MKKKLISLIILISLCSSMLLGQENDDVVVPYKQDEFPQWTLDLRRAEIVSVGSFPLSFMLTALAYDFVQSASTGFDGSVSFGSSRDQDDIKKLLIISGSISLAIGLTDFIIHQVKRSRSEKEQEELDEQRKNNSEPTELSENESR